MIILQRLFLFSLCKTNHHAFKLFLIIGFDFFSFTLAVVMLCCCFRFRIPRTKQEIEADYQRRVIARSFREHLANIKNCEMDDMNLQKGESNDSKCRWHSIFAVK